MKRKPTFLEAFSPFIVLTVVVGIGFAYLEIPIQPLLILSAAYAAIIAVRVGLSWKDMEDGIIERLKTAMPAVFILFAVGVIIGTWVFSGTVPMLIYYGLKIINPTYFLMTAFAIVAVVSVATGTAWGSTATAGVALITIASQLNIPLGIAAGAIISGGVFGDKLSPLSDTTNLAPLVVEIDIYDHIKHMLYTTIPASLVGVMVWGIAGVMVGSGSNPNEGGVKVMLEQLDTIYHWNVFMLLPFIIVLWGAVRKKPTVPIMLFSSLVAVFVGVLSNGFSLVDGMISMANGFDMSMITSPQFNSDNIDNAVSSLINRGGIFSMTTIVVTIFCGYAFAGIVEVSGCLDVLLDKLFGKVKTPVQLIGVTIIASTVIVFTSGVASISIIMVGVLLKDVYKDLGLQAKNLSRTLEDAGTMLLPLVPWGVSGVYYHEVLGVSVGAYWLWSVPCYLCIVFAMIYAKTGFGIAKMQEEK
ncbi:Na+/H+ antiporter NhaC [Virgibacillus halophilus]|uniref:Na+/H+ antiporter NhaC n=1 Tax=Tigheibacillus halophilus TaxID=361280 RepID=UPI003639656F